MTTNEAFEQMINTRGIFHKLGLSKGTVGKMRSDMRAGLNNISLDKKITHLHKAGYIINQEMLWGNNEGVNSLLHLTLLKWWDFMDNDCTANRNEYTEQEQIDLIQRFMAKQSIGLQGCIISIDKQYEQKTIKL